MATNNYTLVIGDKNLSSWSLRPWLAMKQCGIPFAEECVRLRQPDSKAEILRHSPSGKVPALKTRTGVVWDSLAILDYLAERHPERKLWPVDEEARAVARSISAEMHSGFVTLRNDMSMDLLSKLPAPPMSAALEYGVRVRLDEGMNRASSSPIPSRPKQDYLSNLSRPPSCQARVQQMAEVLPRRRRSARAWYECSYRRCMARRSFSRA